MRLRPRERRFLRKLRLNDNSYTMKLSLILPSYMPMLRVILPMLMARLRKKFLLSLRLMSRRNLTKKKDREKLMSKGVSNRDLRRKPNVKLRNRLNWRKRKKK